MIYIFIYLVGEKSAQNVHKPPFEQRSYLHNKNGEHAISNV